MSNDPVSPSIDGNVRMLQIIHIALTVGVLFFLAIVVLVVRKGEIFGKEPWSVTSLLTLAATLFGAAAIVAHLVIPGLVVSAQRKALAQTAKSEPKDFESMLMLYATQKIMGSAIIEGAAFFNVVAYFIEGTAASLLLALLLLAILAGRIPSRDGMQRWIDAQLAQLREERHLG